MTVSQTIKRMPTASMQLLHTVPIGGGELIMDAMSNRIKVGDGKTALKDLPWVDFNPGLSCEVKRLIEENINLIEQNRFAELFEKPKHLHEAKELLSVLLKADIDVKYYLNPVPEWMKGWL